MTGAQIHIAETLARLSASPAVKTVAVTEKHESFPADIYAHV